MYRFIKIKPTCVSATLCDPRTLHMSCEFRQNFKPSIRVSITALASRGKTLFPFNAFFSCRCRRGWAGLQINSYKPWAILIKILFQFTCFLSFKTS